MTWKVGEEKSLIPGGVYPAICYGVYEIGEQYSPGGVFNGKSIHAGWRKQVVLTWEIPSERIDVERDGQTVNLPRAISKFYTQSLNPNAHLRKDLEAWRGKPFDINAEKEFDRWSVIHWKTQGCMANFAKGNQQGKLNKHQERLWCSPSCEKGSKLF